MHPDSQSFRQPCPCPVGAHALAWFFCHIIREILSQAAGSRIPRPGLLFAPEFHLRVHKLRRQPFIHHVHLKSEPIRKRVDAAHLPDQIPLQLSGQAGKMLFGNSDLNLLARKISRGLDAQHIVRFPIPGKIL